MHKTGTEVSYHKFSRRENSWAVKVAMINIWLITGNSVKFAPAMIERRERVRSLLLLKYLKGKDKT
jgi:hypothetical protein